MMTMPMTGTCPPILMQSVDPPVLMQSINQRGAGKGRDDPTTPGGMGAVVGTMTSTSRKRWGVGDFLRSILNMW